MGTFNTEWYGVKFTSYRIKSVSNSLDQTVEGKKRAAFLNPVKNRVLQSCSNIFFTVILNTTL